jgi:Ca2+-binding RTX toxin-like protein
MRIGFIAGVALALGAGAALAASIVCVGGTCTGTDRPDRIIGSDGRDAIFARGNRDQVSARAGADELHGNGGPDDLCGESGNDFYAAGKRSDILSEFGTCGRDFRPAGDGVSSGDDHMEGGGGNDFIEGNDGADVLIGGNGADIQGSGTNGGQGYTQMYGDPGDDVLRGKEKADGMEGEEGDDRHFGGRGNDVIDASNDESPGSVDLVDCGDGFDRAIANRVDVVRPNCERVLRRGSGPTARAAASDAEQDRARSAARAVG